MNSIFKAYDIRGIYPAELNEETAFKAGKATALYLKAKKMVVGQDARLSSDPLAQKVIDGITSTGCNVIHISQTTTPLFYFSVNTTGADGGIMITASHNPKEYNGFKIVGQKSMPISRASGLDEIEKLLETPVPETERGSVDRQEFIDDYVNFLLEETQADKADLGKVKMVADTSNGMAGLVLKNLFRKINITAFALFFEPDGSFPNHSPDTSLEDSLRHLREEVRRIGADFGVAFDGDGDRLALVDEQGNIVRADIVLGLLFEMQNHPETVYDLRASRSIRELLGEKGAMSRAGSAFIKHRMREVDADLGGELSGHFFFKEMNYCESAVMAMLKIIMLLQVTNRPLSAIIKPLVRYHHSGEINIPIGSSSLKERIFETVKNKYSNGKFIEIDGITVEYSDWWFNVRASNTEPIIRLVVEADTEELMRQKGDELLEIIKSAS